MFHNSRISELVPDLSGKDQALIWSSRAITKDNPCSHLNVLLDTRRSKMRGAHHKGIIVVIVIWGYQVLLPGTGKVIRKKTLMVFEAKFGGELPATAIDDQTHAACCTALKHVSKNRSHNFDG